MFSACGVVPMKNDLTNQTFGLLTAKRIVGKDSRGYLWYCECQCGGEKVVPAVYLRNLHTRSCGCLGRKIKENSIKKGDRWGFLEAVEFVEYETRPDGKRRAVWLFRCKCGEEKKLPVANVKFGNVRSCGCKAREHITNLKKEDITGVEYDRLKAVRPTDKRDKSGSIIWEFECQCGGKIEISVNAFRSGRYHSCGCFYEETRKDCTSYRKDFVDNTCLSTIVAGKKPSTLNTSGHTGVYLDKRSGKWQAYINYKKKRYHLGFFKEKEDAIRARKEGEARIHDPVIMEHFQNLTPESKKEFIEYLKSVGAAVALDKQAGEMNEQTAPGQQGAENI